VGKIAKKKKNSLKKYVLLIRHSKYSAILSEIHSYRLLFRRFFPLEASTVRRKNVVWTLLRHQNSKTSLKKRRYNVLCRRRRFIRRSLYIFNSLCKMKLFYFNPKCRIFMHMEIRSCLSESESEWNWKVIRNGRRGGSRWHSHFHFGRLAIGDFLHLKG